MARQQNKRKMGYFPLLNKHWTAISSLFTAKPETRALDPFAGGDDADNGGNFMHWFAGQHQLNAYVNELDAIKARTLVPLFGHANVVQGAAEHLSASNNAFPFIWANPPYDEDSAEIDAGKRVELALLDDVWKLGQPGGIIVWCVYIQHITERAAMYLATRCSDVHVWGLPGKHLGEYDQMFVVCTKASRTRLPDEKHALYESILTQKMAPRMLKQMDTPIYQIPANRPVDRFYFTSATPTPEYVSDLLKTRNATTLNPVQTLLEPPPMFERRRSIHAPRPGHAALVAGSGGLDGVLMDTADFGRVAMRAKKSRSTELVSHQVIANEEERTETDRTVISIKPRANLRLLDTEGKIITLTRDSALLDFIVKNAPAISASIKQRYDALYTMDFNGLRPWLNDVRLGDEGEFGLYLSQKHVAAAVMKGFQHMPGILLVGEMGTGKTTMGSVSMMAMLKGKVPGLEHARNKVNMVVCPPHLARKWVRELRWQDGNALIERVDNTAQMDAFMERAADAGDMPKIMVVKRDLTKLGCGWTPAAVWLKKVTTNWSFGFKPAGIADDAQRLTIEAVPHCPHCNAPVYNGEDPATAAWLASNRRQCETCGTPLWQEKREIAAAERSVVKAGVEIKPETDKGEALAQRMGAACRRVLPFPDLCREYLSPAEYQPRKSPRYRLDEYFKAKYGNKLFLLVWDEIHEAQNSDTGNGEAFNRLSTQAEKTLALTGTPVNGYASSAFNMEYALNPLTREMYPWGGAVRCERKVRGSRHFQKVIAGTGSVKGAAEARWVRDMGVLEQTIDKVSDVDPRTGTTTGTETYHRPYVEAPGISADLVMFMQPHTIYFSLRDLNKELPEFEEITMPVSLDGDHAEAYDNFVDEVKGYMRAHQNEKGGLVGMLGSYLQAAMSYPNAPFCTQTVTHTKKDKSKEHVATAELFEHDRVYAKEQALIDLVRDELKEGRPCIVYLRQTQTRSLQPRIEEMIRRECLGASTYVLTSKVEAERREAVINGKVEDGINTLICHPKLVETGLDLIAFPTIIVYEIVYQLTTLMQAVKRSYRLTQKAKKCKVVYMYAKGTMEATAISLMARKQRALKMLTGDLGLTGLDMLTEREDSFEQQLLNTLATEVKKVELDAAGLREENDFDKADAMFWNQDINAEPEPVIAPTPAKTDPMDIIAWLEERRGKPFPKKAPQAPVVMPAAGKPVQLPLF